jgi:hypothetical protein
MQAHALLSPFPKSVNGSVAAQPIASNQNQSQQSFENSFPRHHHNDEGPMSSICEPTPRKFHGVRKRNKSRIGTGDLTDWLADVLRNKSAKEIADNAGCGIRTAENVKQGRNSLSGKHLASLQMNDPDIAAAWAEYVGLILPGEAEYAGAVTKAVNAGIRRKAAREGT